MTYTVYMRKYSHSQWLVYAISTLVWWIPTTTSLFTAQRIEQKWASRDKDLLDVETAVNDRLSQYFVKGANGASKAAADLADFHRQVKESCWHCSTQQAGESLVNCPYDPFWTPPEILGVSSG